MGRGWWWGADDLEEELRVVDEASSSVFDDIPGPRSKAGLSLAAPAGANMLSTVSPVTLLAALCLSLLLL